MNLKITHRFEGLEAQDSWKRLVAQLLKNLQSLTTLTSADVLLELHTGSRPMYRVQVVLEVDEDELRAEATEGTRQAALLKATENLERQIRNQPVPRAGAQRTYVPFGGNAQRRNSEVRSSREVNEKQK